jgi:acyl dehydratase
VNARQETEFHAYPPPGTTLLCRGRIIDKYIRREKPYVVFDAVVTDDTGRLIERYKQYRMVAAPEFGKKWWGEQVQSPPIVKRIRAGSWLRPVTKRVTREGILAFERSAPALQPNLHSSVEIAENEGIKDLVGSAHMQLAYIDEALRGFFDSWPRAGRVDVRFLHPIVGGDEITVDGVVVAVEADEKDWLRVSVNVRCRNQRFEDTSAGVASGLVPVAHFDGPVG